MGEYQRKLRARLQGVETIDLRKPAPALMTESEWYARRRMFCVVKGVARVADPETNTGHRTWMADLTDLEYRRSPRGYVLDGKMVWYIDGFDFVSPRDIRRALPVLVALMGLKPKLEIWNGGREVENTGVFVGRDIMGTIADFVEFM